MRLPEVKTPKFLTDLVRDLRDRRLLPLVAVLVVAIVAVPIALSKSAAQPPSTAAKSSLLGAAPDGEGIPPDGGPGHARAARLPPAPARSTRHKPVHASPLRRPPAVGIGLEPVQQRGGIELLRERDFLIGVRH